METEVGSGRDRSFLIPCILLMLQAGPRETGELGELLAAFGFHRQVGALGATLQWLEDDRLIRSVGPAGGSHTGSPYTGSCYQLTAGGEQWLAARAQTLAEPARLLGRFLDGYASLVTAAASAEEDGPVTVESDRAGNM